MGEAYMDHLPQPSNGNPLDCYKLIDKHMTMALVLTTRCHVVRNKELSPAFWYEEAGSGHIQAVFVLCIFWSFCGMTKVALSRTTGFTC